MPAEQVKDWPKMPSASALAFKRWVGKKNLDGLLVRKGPRIFLVSEATLAECMYNHDREF